MGLVHRIEGDFHAFEQRDVLRFGERFRRYVQEFGHPPQQIFLHLLHLRPGQGRVQEVGDAVFSGLEAADGIYLVFHQGDQGGDDDGRPLHQQGRQLVAKGLAAAGGHEYKGIVPGNQVADDVFLVPFERIIAKESLQFGMQGGGIYHTGLSNSRV